MKKANNSFYIGRVVSRVTNLGESIANCLENGYPVIAFELENKLLPMEDDCHMPKNEDTENWCYPDLIITPEEWHQRVISILPSSLDCDSENVKFRNLSVRKLERWIAWSGYLHNCGHVMIKLKSANNVNLARVVSDNAKGQIFVEVPVFNRRLIQAAWRTDIPEDTLNKIQEEDTWHWWNSFRWATNFDSKTKVVLKFDGSNIPDQEIICRWLGEPVEAIIIPSTLFIRNRCNFPVLSKQWQEVLKHFLRKNVNILISAPITDNNLKLYNDYLMNLHQTFHIENPYEEFEDFLEIPLQPLHNNLCCATYDVFEKDPIKYRLYQDAIVESLKDRVSEVEISTKLTIVMVLGAGRGPLVRSTLNASKLTGRKVRIYVIEKNPNAICVLKNLIQKLWKNDDVHLFSKDMREFAPPEKADILVSELLGSFGDNELSPECLDCARKLLKTDGISIPYKSISFINPIMSSRLHNAVRNIRATMPFNERNFLDGERMLETAYVVLFKNIFNISPPQPLFEFIHPNLAEETTDNSRYKVLKFRATMDSVINGFGGYFEAFLYKDIMISINPRTHTSGMMSWFPMFFPVQTPCNIKKDDIIELHFWRRVSSVKVWYEWMITSPFKTGTFNRFGRDYCIYTN